MRQLLIVFMLTLASCADSNNGHPRVGTPPTEWTVEVINDNPEPTFQQLQAGYRSKILSVQLQNIDGHPQTRLSEGESVFYTGKVPLSYPDVDGVVWVQLYTNPPLVGRYHLSRLDLGDHVVIRLR